MKGGGGGETQLVLRGDIISLIGQTIYPRTGCLADAGSYRIQCPAGQFLGRTRGPVTPVVHVFGLRLHIRLIAEHPYENTYIIGLYIR